MADDLLPLVDQMIAIDERLVRLEELHRRRNVTDVLIALQMQFIRAREAARTVARELLYAKGA